MVILNWTWGIGMTLIGAIVYIVLFPFGIAGFNYAHPYLFISRGWGAITLGWFTICSRDRDDFILAHETGHVIQNAMLGIFFPFVIAVPSLIHALAWRMNPAGSYFDFYTERWANNLENVHE